MLRFPVSYYFGVSCRKGAWCFFLFLQARWPAFGCRVPQWSGGGTRCFMHISLPTCVSGCMPARADRLILKDKWVKKQNSGLVHAMLLHVISAGLDFFKPYNFKLLMVVLLCPNRQQKLAAKLPVKIYSTAIFICRKLSDRYHSFLKLFFCSTGKNYSDYSIRRTRPEAA